MASLNTCCKLILGDAFSSWAVATRRCQRCGQDSVGGNRQCSKNQLLNSAVLTVFGQGSGNFGARLRLGGHRQAPASCFYTVAHTAQAAAAGADCS